MMVSLPILMIIFVAFLSLSPLFVFFSGGLYPTPFQLSFDTITSTRKSQSLSIRLLNSGENALKIEKLYPRSPDPNLVREHRRKR